MQRKTHWEQVYTTKQPDAVSWYQPHAGQSLALIRATGVAPDAPIIDVGGGASTLVDDLLAAGYTNLTVLDIAAAALQTAQQRLGEHAAQVRWIEADLLSAALEQHAYAVWHDRAVFHFLTAPADQQAYVDLVRRSVHPDGHVIVATFADDGPTHCSGLPVARYSPDQLHATFGAPFTLVEQRREAHPTPFGTVQQFVYCYCRKHAPNPPSITMMQ
jgi:2-polyprenyl-3-methyl-5-hydroxy-6-metoxy-1,4-benzoquinol methylase